MTELNQRQAEFAQALYQSYVTNVALNEDDWQGVVQDFETAYAVQERVMTLKGQPTAGYKVSLTSEETQKMFDTDAPLFGQQVAERFLKGPAGSTSTTSMNHWSKSNSPSGPRKPSSRLIH